MGLRVGIGYDSHRLETGESLVIGGFEIEHDRGLAGHSDADVLTHAVIDALLGSFGLGDLGELFPPDEKEWKDASSIDMLRVVLGKLPGAVVNVDATLICEEPKLAPYKAQIASLLSGALSAPVSVKASTNEGMGAIGRGEGIACIAVALIETGDPLPGDALENPRI
jgi:2-C-methyl-D-erythritol 2,4-cyclodiphosphate synthase